MLRVSGDINAISSEMRLLRRGDAGQESYNDKQVDKVHLQLVYYYIHLCLDFGRKISATGESGGYPTTSWKVQLAVETKNKAAAAVRRSLSASVLVAMDAGESAGDRFYD